MQFLSNFFGDDLNLSVNIYSPVHALRAAVPVRLELSCGRKKITLRIHTVSELDRQLCATEEHVKKLLQENKGKCIPVL